MTDAMDMLHKLMDKAGVDVDAVQQAAETLDLEQVEREEVLRDEQRRSEKAAASVTTDDIPDPAQPEQLALSDPDADTRGQRHADAGATELAAANVPRTGTQRRLVLDAIGASGDGGMTDEEIARAPGVADTAHRTRRNELVEGGWVEDSGRVRQTDSGTDSIVWILTAQGRAQWRRPQ